MKRLVGAGWRCWEVRAHCSPFHPYGPSDPEFHPHPGVGQEGRDGNQGWGLPSKGRAPETLTGSPKHSPGSPSLLVCTLTPRGPGYPRGP